MDRHGWRVSHHQAGVVRPIYLRGDSGPHSVTLGPPIGNCRRRGGCSGAGRRRHAAIGCTEYRPGAIDLDRAARGRVVGPCGADFGRLAGCSGLPCRLRPTRAGSLCVLTRTAIIGRTAHGGAGVIGAGAGDLHAG